MGKAQYRSYNSGCKTFAGGNGDLFGDPAFATAGYRAYVEGKATRSNGAKRFIEREGEFNPNEITEEDHKKYKQECGQAEAEGTFIQSMSTNQSTCRATVASISAPTALHYGKKCRRSVQRRWQKKSPSILNYSSSLNHF
jgi:hypothetical protein